MSFGRVKGLLGDLSNSQLTSVINTCASLIANKDPRIRRQMLLYSCVTEAICAVSGKATFPIYYAFAKTGGAPFLRKGVDIIEDLLSVHAPDIKRAEQRRAYMLVARVVVEHQLEFGGGMTPTRVLQKIPDIRALLNVSFPGYLVCGLGHAIFLDLNKRGISE